MRWLSILRCGMSYGMLLTLLVLGLFVGATGGDARASVEDPVEGGAVDLGKSLLDAAGEGKVKKVKALLAKGADPTTAKNGWGETALHTASISPKLKIIDALIASGADVNALTDGRYDGHAEPVRRTPLMWMVYSNHKDMFAAVKSLVRAGARLDIRNEEGDTVIDLVKGMQAASADVDELLAFLQETAAAHKQQQDAASEL